MIMIQKNRLAYHTRDFQILLIMNVSVCFHSFWDRVCFCLSLFNILRTWVQSGIGGDECDHDIGCVGVLRTFREYISYFFFTEIVTKLQLQDPYLHLSSVLRSFHYHCGCLIIRALQTVKSRYCTTSEIHSHPGSDPVHFEAYVQNLTRGYKLVNR